MGPVSDLPARLAPLAIGGNRKGTVKGGLVHLELELTGRPDPVWLDAFARHDAPPALNGAAVAEHPSVKGSTIRWSVPAPCLMAAWQYLCRCVDRANATSARVPTARGLTTRVSAAPSPTAPPRGAAG